MAYDGHIRFNTKIDNSQVGKELKRIENQIKRSQDSISRAQTAKMPLVKQMESLNVELDKASAKLKKLQVDQKYSEKVLSNGINGNVFDPKYYVDPEKFMEISSNKAALDDSVLEQQKIVDALQKKWNDASAAVEKYDRKIQEANISIEQNTAKAGALSAKLIKPNADKMHQAFEKVQKSAARFGSRILEIAKSAFIFNIISSGLRAIATHMGTVLKTNSEYTAQLAQLKGALLTAFQPIYEFILPGLLAIQEALLTIVRVAATVISALFGKTVTQSAKNAQALNKQAEAISGVGSAAEEASKQVMGFDEINKFNTANAGGGGGASGSITPDFNGINAGQYSGAIDRLVAPLREIDFTALRNSLAGLGNSFSDLGSIIKESLEWAWYEILAPLSEWTIEEAAPVAVDSLASALDMLSEVLGPVVDGLKLFWEWVQPVVEFVQETVILVFEKFKEAFDNLAQVFREKGPEITGIISNIGETLAIIWELIEPTMKDLRDLFGEVFSKVVELAGKAIGRLIEIFYNLSEFVAGFLSQDWQRAWDGIKNVVSESAGFISDMVYGLQDLIGRIIDGIIQAICDVLAMIDGWFSGGKSSGESNTGTSTSNTSTYSTVATSLQSAAALPSIPIPALAQGAVLPANKPFLAMVGDQTNGTNVEAPLETIKQALAEVMAEIGGGDVQITFTGELAALGKVLAPVVTKAQRDNDRGRGK